MTRNSNRRIFGGVLLALALIGARSANAEPKKMALSRMLKAGVITTYKSQIKASVQGMDIVIDQSKKQTIKTIKENGNIVVLSEDLGGTMKLNGMEQEQKPGAPSTETRDKLGKLVEFSHEQDQNAPFTPEIQKLIASLSELILTDKEVVDGDSWDTQLDNPASKDNKIKVKTTYQGIEKVDGVELWKFKQTAEAIVSADGAKVAQESTIWLNPKDGLMEKSDSKVKDAPTQFGPLDFVVVVNRVKATAADVKTDK